MLGSVELRLTSSYTHRLFSHKERAQRELVENNLSRFFQALDVQNQSSFSRH